MFEITITILFIYGLIDGDQKLILWKNILNGLKKL